MKYRRNDIRADAAAKGWDLSDLFRMAQVNRWTGYDFMRGKTNSARIAAALTLALGRRPGFYQVRGAERDAVAS
jgi:hypothetical protein